MFAFAGGFSASGGRHEAAIQVAVQTEEAACRYHKRPRHDPTRQAGEGDKGDSMMNYENPADAGPEYEAYLMRRIAEDLSELDDIDLAVAAEEIGMTTAILIDRMREFERGKVA